MKAPKEWTRRQKIINRKITKRATDKIETMGLTVMDAKAIELLNRDLKLSSLKLVKKTRRIRDSDGKIREFSQTELAVSTDFQSNERTTRKVAGTLCWLAAALFHVYVFMKLLSLTILHYKLDSISTRLWPNTDQDLNQSKCLTSSQNSSLIISNPAAHGRFIALEANLLSWNALFPSLSGVNSICYNLVCSGILYALLFGLVVVKIIKPRFAAYDLICNKNEERSRFQCELDLLCENLFTCQELEIDGRSMFEYRPKFRFKPSRTFYQPTNECANSGYDKPNRKYADHALRVDRRLVNLVEPAHLSDWFSKILMTYMNWKVSIRWLVFMVPSWIVLVYTMSSEVYNRAIYRLNLLQCQAVHSTPARVPIRLASIESNDEYLAAYRNHDPTSLVSLLNLVLIEARLHLRPGVLLTMVEILLVIYSLTLLSTIFIEMYAYEYSSKLCWLMQIESQIKRSLWEMKRMIRSSRLKLPREEIDRQKNQCLKSLTLAYLNYELFRRQQKAYQTITNLLLAQMALVQIQSLVVSYLSCVNIKSSSTNVVLVMTTYVSGVVNAYLITGSIRTGKALELMNNITRIVVLSGSSPLRQTPIINHWSDQMLDRKATKDCFAPNFFGLTVSYDKIIALNAYLLILWHILILG